MSDVYVMNKMIALNECIRIHHDVKNSELGIDPPSFIPDELIYLVDDEEMLKELVSMGLKMIGWEVQSAGDGPAALAIARDWRPDVLVLDIMMPGFDGL